MANAFNNLFLLAKCPPAEKLTNIIFLNLDDKISIDSGAWLWVVGWHSG